MELKVAARDSNLSKKQVEEMSRHLKNYWPDLQIETLYLKSFGDLNHGISLRDSTFDDLFTKEIDQQLFSEKVEITIHSAKDLPKNLDPRLQVYWLTPSICPYDAIVFKERFSLATIPERGVILASSERREAMIKQLRSDLVVLDVRGTIEERIEKLNQKEVYGVVIAEAALIRLGLTHLNRQIVSDVLHPMQGRLAVVGLKNNPAIEALFAPFHA